MAKNSSLTVEVQHEGGNDLVLLSGYLDTATGDKLAVLFSRPPARSTTFDFDAVTGINSLGVSAWVNFLRAFGSGREVLVENCTPSLVEQFNLIRSMTAGVTVRSLYVPMICQSCQRDGQAKLAVPQLHDPKARSALMGVCGFCKGGQVPGIDLDDYLGFLPKR